MIFLPNLLLTIERLLIHALIHRIYTIFAEDRCPLHVLLRESKSRIWSIDNDILQKTQKNLLKRLRACVPMDDGHFYCEERKTKDK